MRYLRYPPAWHTAAAGLPVRAAARSAGTSWRRAASAR